MEHLWCHEKKRSRRVLLWCDVDMLYENTLVLKNKQVNTFLSENLILMKFRSYEVFGKNGDLIHLLSLTQIDLDIGTTIKGMMFHHHSIREAAVYADRPSLSSTSCKIALLPCALVFLLSPLCGSHILQPQDEFCPQFCLQKLLSICLNFYC